MPPRSNDFQRLVELIQRLYAPQNAKVTPSAVVNGREVDVLVEYQTDLYPVTIAVEARDHSRRIDVIGVEAYIGKYNAAGIRADKVIIVARSFTERAKQKAGQFGFTLLTLNDLEHDSAKAFFRAARPGDTWWLGKSKPNKDVQVCLLDKGANPIPLESIITPKSSKANHGTASMWAERLLQHALSQKVDGLFAQYAGVMLAITAEFRFTDHRARFGSVWHNIGKLVFDFGTRMQMPPMIAEKFQLGGSPEPKTIVREVGTGSETTLTLLYEENPGEAFPMKLYLDHRDTSGNAPQGKKIVIVLS